MMRANRAGLLAGMGMALCVPTVLMAVTNTFQSGNKISATEVNQNFAELESKIAALQGKVATLDRIAFRASIQQGFPRVTWTKAINFNAPEWNHGSGFNAATGEFTAPAPGMYHIQCGAKFNYPGMTAFWGTRLKGLLVIVQSGSVTDGHAAYRMASASIPMVIGDKVTCEVDQETADPAEKAALVTFEAVRVSL